MSCGYLLASLKQNRRRNGFPAGCRTPRRETYNSALHLIVGLFFSFLLLGIEIDNLNILSTQIQVRLDGGDEDDFAGQHISLLAWSVREDILIRLVERAN
jgi:hypothetical protein